MFAWKQPSSWKREGHLLVILACDGKINSRSSSGCRASVGMTRSIAHRNHVTSVSDLGIALPQKAPASPPQGAPATDFHDHVPGGPGYWLPSHSRSHCYLQTAF